MTIKRTRLNTIESNVQQIERCTYTTQDIQAIQFLIRVVKFTEPLAMTRL